jgi:hypothetical protein
MESVVIEKLSAVEESEVDSLVLDNIPNAKRISGLSDKLVALRTLSMCNCGLQSLEGLPCLPSLQRLRLADNKLTGDLLKLSLAKLQQLEYLDLSNNRIADTKALAPLKSLSKLTYLDVDACELAKETDYRSTIFALLPQVKVIDGQDQDGTEVEGYQYSGEEEYEEEEEEEEEEDYDDGDGGDGFIVDDDIIPAEVYGKTNGFGDEVYVEEEYEEEEEEEDEDGEDEEEDEEEERQGGGPGLEYLNRTINEEEEEDGGEFEPEEEEDEEDDEDEYLLDEEDEEDPHQGSSRDYAEGSRSTKRMKPDM